MRRLEQVISRLVVSWKLAPGWSVTQAMNIRPIRDQVLVRQDPKQEKVGSLFVPQGSEDYPNHGTILAVGPGTVTQGGQFVELTVSVGQRVLFKRRPNTALVPDAREDSGSEFKNLLMLRESDILAIVEES